MSMFSIFNKTPKAPENYFPFSADLHSHILPGLDDGSPDVHTSILLIEGLMRLGIHKSIATPHIIGDLYRNNAITINTSLSLLKDELRKQNIHFEITAAAEYMLDGYFLELLFEKKPLLTLYDNVILTEFSYSSKPDHMEKMSFAILSEGYQPVLAHPERYAYFHNNYEEYQRLKDLGFMLQLNILSLTGYYGKAVEKAAVWMVQNDLISFVATDLHHEKHLAALSDAKCRNIFYKHLHHQLWNDIITSNL